MLKLHQSATCTFYCQPANAAVQNDGEQLAESQPEPVTNLCHGASQVQLAYFYDKMINEEGLTSTSLYWHSQAPVLDALLNLPLFI